MQGAGGPCIETTRVRFTEFSAYMNLLNAFIIEINEKSPNIRQAFSSRICLAELWKFKQKAP